MPLPINDPSARDLQDEYIEHITGKASGPPPLLARVPTASLLAMQGEAAQLSSLSQASVLEPDLRGELVGKRSPLLSEILHLCARGLYASADFAKKVGVAGEKCEQVQEQDTALGQLIKAGGDLHTVASSAAAQVAAGARREGEKVLAGASELVRKAGADPAMSLGLEVSFAEPFRLYEEAEGKGAREEKRRQGRLGPLLSMREQVRAETEELRLIDRFLQGERSKEETR